MTHCLRTYDRGVLRVTIDRPAKRNALSREVLRELRSVFEMHAVRDDLRLAVLGGAGELAFSVGADLGELRELREPEDVERYADEATAALDVIRLFPVPTVAALNGTALGGGAELALACDMRLAAPHARIGFTHAKLNVSTAWGGGADLMRLAGAPVALELLASARTLSAEEARAVGLVNQVAPKAVGFIDFVDRFLEPAAERPPHLLRALKSQAIAERLGASMERRRETDRERFVETWTHPAHWAAAEAWEQGRR
jgi:enoyl-CoA hydratase/carnithine racemase